MSEEIKTEIEAVQPTETKIEKKVVELSQDKVDSLINEAYKRGAVNGNKELVNQLDEAKSIAEELKAQLKKQQEELEFQQIVNNYEVDKVNYFKSELAQAKSQEGFDLDKWVNDFKEKESFVFKGGSKSSVKVDNSANNLQAPDFASRVKTARTMQELYELQKNL